MTLFIIWPHGMDSILEFRDHLNTVHPTIKFISDISHTGENNEDKNIQVMSITTYSRANPNFKELFSNIGLT